MKPAILSGPIAPCRQVPAMPRTIPQLCEQLAKHPQVEMPVVHRFSPGVYAREIFMPADTFVIGHKHKTKHFNIILTGKARVMMDGVIHHIVAPHVMESEAGVQKILYIEEDMCWITIHANPSEERDIVKLEESLVELSAEMLDKKGSMELDNFRMLVNQKKGIQ